MDCVTVIDVLLLNMSKPETPQQMADRLKFEYDASGNMDGILYEDENRELATEKSILQVKGLTNNKEDSNDRPDIPTPAVPFWVNIKR